MVAPKCATTIVKTTTYRLYGAISLEKSASRLLFGIFGLRVSHSLPGNDCLINIPARLRRGCCGSVPCVIAWRQNAVSSGVISLHCATPSRCTGWRNGLDSAPVSQGTNLARPRSGIGRRWIAISLRRIKLHERMMSLGKPLRDVFRLIWTLTTGCE